MRIAIDFENTLTKREVFNLANDLLNQGIEVTILTQRIGHINSFQNQDILKICRDLGLPYSSVVFTLDLVGYFRTSDYCEVYLSDNLINLQLVDSEVNCIQIFGNKDWENACLEALIPVF